MGISKDFQNVSTEEFAIFSLGMRFSLNTCRIGYIGFPRRPNLISKYDVHIFIIGYLYLKIDETFEPTNFYPPELISECENKYIVTHLFEKINNYNPTKKRLLEFLKDYYNHYNKKIEKEPTDNWLKIKDILDNTIILN